MRISDWSSDVCSSDLIADDLALAHAFAHMRGDFAHVGIAGGKSPGMLDLDVIAMAAMTTRIDDLAVSHRVNGRAIARTEINACMHAAITQYGMPAQSIRRGLPSGDRKSTRLNSSH